MIIVYLWSKTMRVKMLMVTLLVSGLAVSACGGGNQDWYANGKTWATVSGKAQGDASLVGVTPRAYCTTDLDMGKAALIGTPLNAPSLSDQSAVNAWVSGCTVGVEATDNG
jgi:hypothetical protein